LTRDWCERWLARVQGARKDLNLGYTERIRLAVEGDDRIQRVCEESRELIARETLAVEVTTESPAFPVALSQEVEINGRPVRVSVGHHPSRRGEGQRE